MLPCCSCKQRPCLRLAVFEPAEDLGQVGFLAVHQDADAVDAAGEPENGEDGENEADDGECDLPGGWLADGDAHVHDERRAEGEEREGLGDETVGVADDAQNDERAGDERQHEEHVHLLKLLLGAGHGAESGGDAGVEDVAEKEEEDEEADLRWA